MRHPRRLRRLLVAVLAAVFLVGCSQDPNARKREYFESGQRYFQEQNYREATIQYLNALKADPQYAEAHYQLARCYAKLELWNAA
jgi:Tfp pilus assembly protein PilF